MSSIPSILIINPNSTKSMTDGMRNIITPSQHAIFEYFTPPEGPEEINSLQSSFESAVVCIKHLKPLIEKHDAFLIACYSDHPLIYSLKELTTKPVLGIFQASIIHALTMGSNKFAIVTTECFLKDTFSTGIRSFFAGDSNRYLGCYSCGLGVLELHNKPAEYVHTKLAETVKQAVNDGADTILLGCGAMATMTTPIRAAVGNSINIIDGVLAGSELLTGLVRTLPRMPSSAGLRSDL